jgi:predicted peroxiredoxin
MAKFASVINSAPGDPAPMANNLEYASNLDDGGYEVAVFFDGQGTQWIPELEGDTDSVALEYYTEVRGRGLIGEAYGYCTSF